MKRTASLLLALLLLFSLCSCSSPDDLIKAGKHMKAYEKLQASEDPADQEKLKDFWLVPASATETVGTRTFTGTYDWNEEAKTLTAKVVANELEQIMTYVWEGNTITHTSDYVTRIYTCNDEGYVILEQWYYDNEEELNSIKLDYDERGNLIRKTETIIGNEEDSVYEYSYDEQDRLIKETITYSANNTETTQYTYNETGKMLRQELTVVFGDDVDTYITDYLYNEKGQLTRATQTKTDGTDRQESVFTYDDKGNLTCEKWYRTNDLSRETIWTYDDQGRFLTQTRTDQNGNVETLTVDGYTAFYLPGRRPAIDYIIGNFEPDYILYIP